MTTHFPSAMAKHPIQDFHLSTPENTLNTTLKTSPTTLTSPIQSFSILSLSFEHHLQSALYPAHYCCAHYQHLQIQEQFTVGYYFELKQAMPTFITPKKSVIFFLKLHLIPQTPGISHIDSFTWLSAIFFHHGQLNTEFIRFCPFLTTRQ